MAGIDPSHSIRTRIWQEESERDNPFATKAAYCRGYDVFGEMVGNARWAEMLFLLFREELPQVQALDTLEALAVALANPGPRDPSVHAAMCGGVGGSTAGASLIAAIAVGSGRAGGAREVFDAMKVWEACGTDLASWVSHRHSPPTDVADVWPPSQHPSGFDPHAAVISTTVRQLLEKLAGIDCNPHLSWLEQRRQELELAMGMPLAVSGVAAAAFVDLGFTPDEGEMLYLLLRLPGAAAHALEQRRLGYKQFPFFSIELEQQPESRQS